MAAGAPSGAELEPVVRDVVEHGRPFGYADRVLLVGRQAGDGRPTKRHRRETDRLKAGLLDFED